jgi:hypothetical protein
MNPNPRHAFFQAKRFARLVLVTGLALGWGGLGEKAMAAQVSIFLNYADAPLATPAGAAFINGSGSVRLGAFIDQANSSSTNNVFFSTAQLQNIWAAGTRAAFDNLAGAFVPLMSQSFNRTTAGHFRFSTGQSTVGTSIDVNDELTVELGGAQMFVFAADSLETPTAFAILAVDPVTDDGASVSAFPTGEGLDTAFSGSIESSNNSVEAYDTTIIAGSLAGSQLRMATIPASSSGPVLNGSSDVTHFWESGAYSDAGVTAAGPVTTVIRDASNSPVADFSTMAGTLGVYSVIYTADGTSVTRTVRVKLQSASADADNDGLTNLLEYVLGGSLSANDSSRMPSVRISGNELILSFTARSGITGLTPVSLGFVGATSLASTFAAETLTKKTGVSQAGVAAGFEKQEWALSTSSAPRKFVRIKVTLATELSGA